MIEYKMVKYCRACKTRFLVNKGESKQYLCAKCQKAHEKSMGNPSSR